MELEKVIQMNIVDVYDPQRVARKPDGVEILFSSATLKEQEFLINHVELRLYLEKYDEKMGQYSLITSFVETDKGSVEMIFDEGFRDKDFLNSTKQFLVSHLGISGLILRSVLVLREELKQIKK